MTSNADIMVIVPAYNEHDNLKRIIESLLKHNYSVVVIDDGSTPPLSDEISSLPVTYIRHLSNLGQGAALQTGFDYCKKLNINLVVTFDGDGQHDVNDLPALLEPLLNNEADICLGSRFLTVNNSIPRIRTIILKQARLVNFIFTGMLLSDAHNGLRALNKIALHKINITENRMAHASEILFEIRKHNLRFKEVPVHINYTSHLGKNRQSGWNGIKIVFDIILHKLFR
jgi:glycosyltransferase involved in cell wall biosynthesis